MDGSTDDMAVLNMSLSSRCLSEDMTDRGSTAPCWVMMLYSLSAESSLCLDFRFFSGLDHDLVEYGMANLKLLKRWNNRSYDLRYRITDYDIICSIFTIWVILCTFCIYTTNKDLLYEWEMNCYKHDKKTLMNNYKIYDCKMVQADFLLWCPSMVVLTRTKIQHVC